MGQSCHRPLKQNASLFPRRRADFHLFSLLPSVFYSPSLPLSLVSSFSTLLRARKTRGGDPPLSRTSRRRLESQRLVSTREHIYTSACMCFASPRAMQLRLHLVRVRAWFLGRRAGAEREGGVYTRGENHRVREQQQKLCIGRLYSPPVARN